MTNLLDEAYAAAKELPEEEQEAIGAVLLAEIDADRRWDELFAKPSDVIERMADKALEDYRLGRTLPLDVFLDTQRD
jgi:methylase of polypeptide subunit release factors